jgi:hypothetical protein
MGTDEPANLDGEQPIAAGLGLSALDVDMDPEMTRIMSETQEAAEAIRQSFVSASRARDETITQARSEADRMRAEAGMALADARAEADKLTAESNDEIEARLKEAEEESARRLAQAADQADELLRDARAEHAALSETIPRLRAAVAEMETFIEAFRHATRRFEDATGEMPIADETDGYQPSSAEIGNGTTSRERPTDHPPDQARDSKQAAFETLRSLSI